MSKEFKELKRKIQSKNKKKSIFEFFGITKEEYFKRTDGGYESLFFEGKMKHWYLDYETMEAINRDDDPIPYLTIKGIEPKTIEDFKEKLELEKELNKNDYEYAYYFKEEDLEDE